MWGFAYQKNEWRHRRAFIHGLHKWFNFFLVALVAFSKRKGMEYIYICILPTRTIPKSTATEKLTVHSRNERKKPCLGEALVCQQVPDCHTKPFLLSPDIPHTFPHNVLISFFQVISWEVERRVGIQSERAWPTAYILLPSRAGPSICEASDRPCHAS